MTKQEDKIKELEQENKELRGRNHRLKCAVILALDSVEKELCLNIIEESPKQSIANIEADAIFKMMKSVKPEWLNNMMTDAWFRDDIVKYARGLIGKE